ncbi:MAG: exodeoxyribonuclease VII small subunit [Anaerolineaceae bacterium]
MPTNDTPNFEIAFAQLQQVIEKLENSELPLDEAMRLYEEGKHLSATCASILESAQLRLTQLSEASSNKEAPDADDELNF